MGRIMGRIMREIFGRPWVPLLLGLLLIGLYSAFGPDSKKLEEISEWGITAWHASRDLGIAFIVGAIIAGGIEQVAREERRADVEQHVSAVHSGVIQAMLKKEFPEDFVDFVLNALKNEELFQRMTRVDIKLRLPDNSNEDEMGLPKDKVIFEYVYMFELQNISEKEIPYQGRMFVEKDWDWEGNESARKLTSISYWKIGDKELSREEIQNAHQAVDDEKYHMWYDFPSEIIIERFSKVNGEVRMKTVKSLRDCTTWTCIRPCDGLKLFVTHPNTIQVVLSAKHPSRVVRESDPASTLTSIEIEQPMFPFTAVEVAWREAGSVPIAGQVTSA